MSDETKEGTAAPAPKTPEPTPAPAAAKPPTVADIPEEALKARLERERKTWLKDLGIETESEEDAKKAFAEYKAKREAEKTESEKTADLIANLKAKASKADRLEEAVKIQADSALAALDDAKRAAVSAITGGDPAKVIGAIEALKPTWVTVPTVQAVATPPTDTVPAPTAPPETKTTPQDRKAQWEELKSTNPFLAYSFYQEHASEIFKQT